MEIKQHEKLLSLYKQAIENKLETSDHSNELLQAKIQLDKEFTTLGKNYAESLRYIEELELLVKHTKDEQS